ncbi:MAG: hypothetical protein JWM63_4 [Gammaproteobacteria bacterium]|jgi:hypothetical protein|nr:hypothetical protein [Gammaproteobacteria bacterium]
MTPRRVAILLGAGVVVIGFAMWVASKRHLDRATHAGDLVMPGLESTLNSVTEIRLAKGDETHTTLKKSATDWIVGERDYPADSGKVRKFLLDLGSLNVVEEKTHNPANYPQLGVEDVTSPKATGTRVDLVTPPKVYGLIIGKSSSAKSGYVRTPSSQLTLLAAPSLSVDADPKRWLEHTLVDIKQERVKEVEEKPGEGPGYAASREKKEQTDFTVSNIPKGRELSSPVAADSIAGALGGMTLDDVRKPAAPANAKVSHAIFRTFDGLELDIAGHKDGTQTFIAITPRSTSKDTEAEAQQLTAQLQGWEYEIPSYKYDGIFKPLEDLLKKPPEATPKKADAKAKKTDKKAAEKAETN